MKKMKMMAFVLAAMILMTSVVPACAIDFRYTGPARNRVYVQGGSAQNDLAYPTYPGMGGFSPWQSAEEEIKPIREVWKDCPACFGGTCPHCNGKGWYGNPYDLSQKITCERECSVCGGEGKYLTFR